MLRKRDAEIRTGVVRYYFGPGNSPILGHEYFQIDGKKEGEYRMYWSNSNLMAIHNYIDNVIDGPYFYWNKNGILLYIDNYKNGVQNGPYIEFRDNGSKWIDGFHLAGNRHGVWKYFWENGVLYRECYYQNGQLQGRNYEYTQTGQLGRITYFRNGDVSWLGTFICVLWYPIEFLLMKVLAMIINLFNKLITKKYKKLIYFGSNK